MEVNYQVETVVPEIPQPVKVGGFVTPGTAYAQPAPGGNTYECLQAIKEILDVREGISGDPLDQVVTYRELYQQGKLDRSVIDNQYRVQLPGFGPVTLPAAKTISTDFNPPPPPTGLTATGALANVILDWNDAQYHNHAYTEIWRSGTNDLGTAVRIGTWLQPAYADNLGQTGLTRFYWIRHVSLSGVPGPFNATSGTSATTGLVDTPNIADFAVTNAKIGNLAVDNAKIANVTITGGKIAASTITASNMVAGTITAASGIIADINADTITSGSIRGINVNAASHTTKGSYLTSALTGGETTVNVKNTADFPTSGTFFAVVYDTNAFDNNLFSYTGKTATTLTGCSGVQAHNNGATIVPAAVKVAALDGNVNEFRLRGDRGDGTYIGLASVGINVSGSDQVVGMFGDTTATKIGVQGKSKNVAGVNGVGDTCPGVVGGSSSGVGGKFGGNATRGNLQLDNANGSTFPTQKDNGQLAQVASRLHYANGSIWKPLTAPYFESSEQTLTAGTNVNVAHGLTDGAGNSIRPEKFEVYLRCKTADAGFAVGQETKAAPEDFDTLNTFGVQVYADTTNISFVVGAGIRVINPSTGGLSGLTLTSWKAVARAY